jgi:ABC-2 type transport system permease protein
MTAGPGRLSLVELRKMTDHSSGRWLIAAVTTCSAANTALQFWGTDRADRSLAGFFASALAPVAFLLPLVAILSVTTEWSQRTALTTFTLVPRRPRIVLAKLSAAVLLAIASVLIAGALAIGADLVAAASHSGAAAWNLTPVIAGQSLLNITLAVLTGTALGLLLRSSPLAIVVYFVLPAVLAITFTLRVLRTTAAWVNLSAAQNPLDQTSFLSAGQWAHLLAASLIWIAIPLALGGGRLLRSDLA